jgi:hypothetical protein
MSSLATEVTGGDGAEAVSLVEGPFPSSAEEVSSLSSDMSFQYSSESVSGSPGAFDSASILYLYR